MWMSAEMMMNMARQNGGLWLPNEIILNLAHSREAKLQMGAVGNAGGGSLRDPNKRYTGVIKSFRMDRKYGFITSPEVTIEFGIDAFLSANELGNFDNGCMVTFQVRQNKEGRP